MNALHQRFSEYVEQCLSRAEKTGRSVLLSNCDWRMAFVRIPRPHPRTGVQFDRVLQVAELAVQVDNIMAKDLKVKVEDEHNALTKDEVDKFLTHLAGPIIQGLL